MANATLQEQARALGDPTRHEVFLHVAESGRPIGIALHLGIAEGLAAGTCAQIEELVAHDPSTAGCVLRIRVGDGDTAPATEAMLSLRT
jgi:hypothetical protein